MDRSSFTHGESAHDHFGLARDLVEGLLARCSFPSPGTKVDVAVSGGADSMALLVLAMAAGCEVHAFHVDHGLRLGSNLEAQKVAVVAQRFGAQFSALTVDVRPGPNLEARARTARYSVLPTNVFTGHTADDQAETMLLNLMRGAAVDGLAGITPARRPILALRRRDTELLCSALDIDIVVDPTNATGVFRRNRVRHEVLPLLAEVAERDVAAVLARQAEIFREVSDYLNEEAAKFDPTDAKALAAAPKALARVALRRWITAEASLNHPPSSATIERALGVVYGQAKATEVGAGWRLARSRQRLYLVEPKS